MGIPILERKEQFQLVSKGRNRRRRGVTNFNFCRALLYFIPTGEAEVRGGEEDF